MISGVNATLAHRRVLMTMMTKNTAVNSPDLSLMKNGVSAILALRNITKLRLPKLTTTNLLITNQLITEHKNLHSEVILK